MAKIRVDPPFSGFVKTAYFCLIRTEYLFLGFKVLFFFVQKEGAISILCMHVNQKIDKIQIIYEGKSYAIKYPFSASSFDEFFHNIFKGI